MGDRLKGTLCQNRGSFGYIQQDDGGENLFVMPAACLGFNGEIPPIDTRVSYRLQECKTGRPRAEDVYDEWFDPPANFVPAGGNRPGFQLANAAPAAPHMSAPRIGGFKSQPWEQAQADSLNSNWVDQVNEDVGTRFSLTAATSGAGGIDPDAPRTGTWSRGVNKFGFIKEDHNGEEMFVLPYDCEAFGNTFPAPGTRVIYNVVMDEKTQQPRAANVQPEDGGFQLPERKQTKSWGQSQNGGSQPQQAPAKKDLQGPRIGTYTRGGDKFGFIVDDAGNEMFTLPGSCAAFGGALPPIGTRVLYDTVLDPKTGKYKADRVMAVEAVWKSHTAEQGAGRNQSSNYGPYSRQGHDPTQSFHRMQQAPVQADFGIQSFDMDPRALAAPKETFGLNNTMHPTSELLAGAVLTCGEKYGFIEQWSGEDKIFFMPFGCPAFGNQMPPVGTEVRYRVVVDAKTGKPRAEDVQPPGENSAYC